MREIYKKLILPAIMLALLLNAGIAGFAADTADANTQDGEVKWIRVMTRVQASSGIQFNLDSLLRQVDRPGDGEYEFVFTVDTLNQNLDGHRYIIATIGGRTETLPHREFTDREEKYGLLNITTLFGGEPKIPAEFIVEAATNGQNLRLYTHLDTKPFIIKDIVVKHYLDDDEEGIIIYSMETDESVQSLPADHNFVSGGMGLEATSTADASYVIMNGEKQSAPGRAEIVDDEPEDNSEHENADSDESGEPEDQTETNMLLIIGGIAIGAALAMTIALAVVIKGKKKG